MLEMPTAAILANHVVGVDLEVIRTHARQRTCYNARQEINLAAIFFLDILYIYCKYIYI